MPTLSVSSFVGAPSESANQVEGASRRSIQPRLISTAYDSETGPFHVAAARPCSGSSSSFYFSPQELRPYRALEQQYAHLFFSNTIREWDESQPLRLNGSQLSSQRVKDIQMDQCAAINLARDGFDAIGTLGLSCCIGIVARGKNHLNETIVSLYHCSGNEEENPVEALDVARQAAENKGASDIEMFLVGGLVSKDPELCTLEEERDLLAVHKAYNIQGVRLHLSRSEGIYDEDAHVNMVVTADQIYYSRGDLYKPM